VTVQYTRVRVIITSATGHEHRDISNDHPRAPIFPTETTFADDDVCQQLQHIIPGVVQPTNDVIGSSLLLLLLWSAPYIRQDVFSKDNQQTSTVRSAPIIYRIICTARSNQNRIPVHDMVFILPFRSSLPHPWAYVMVLASYGLGPASSPSLLNTVANHKL
jgi:hypothetical protein